MSDPNSNELEANDGSSGNNPTGLQPAVDEAFGGGFFAEAFDETYYARNDPCSDPSANYYSYDFDRDPILGQMTDQWHDSFMFDSQQPLIASNFLGAREPEFPSFSNFETLSRRDSDLTPSTSSFGSPDTIGSQPYGGPTFYELLAEQERPQLRQTISPAAISGSLLDLSTASFAERTMFPMLPERTMFPIVPERTMFPIQPERPSTPPETRRCNSPSLSGSDSEPSDTESSDSESSDTSASKRAKSNKRYKRAEKTLPGSASRRPSPSTKKRSKNSSRRYISPETGESSLVGKFLPRKEDEKFWCTYEECAKQGLKWGTQNGYKYHLKHACLQNPESKRSRRLAAGLPDKKSRREGPPLFRCEICQHEFKSENGFQAHQKRNPGTKDGKCALKKLKQQQKSGGSKKEVSEPEMSQGAEPPVQESEVLPPPPEELSSDLESSDEFTYSIGDTRALDTQ